MNYYQFHIGDYASATAHLTPLEDIAYRRLLDRYYMGERALTSDLVDLCRLIRMHSECERNAVAIVVKEFFLCEGGKLISIRAEKEIETFAGKSGKAKASAKARWDKQKTYANALNSHSDGNAKAMLPRTKNQEPVTKKEKKRASTSVFDASLTALPQWLDSELWKRWCADRKKRGKPITEEGARQQLEDLSKWHATGLDAHRAIRDSLAGGWQGLFEPTHRVGTNGSKPEQPITILKRGEL